jgi:hypothetical protein
MNTNVRYTSLRDSQGVARTFPGVSAALTSAALAVQNGVMPDPTTFNVYRHCIQHTRDYAAAGQTTAMKFFNQAPADFIANTPQQGQINDDQFFWGVRLHIDILPNYAAGTPAITNAAAAYITGSAALPGAVTNAQQVRDILNLGRVNFKAGNRNAVVNAQGLHRFGAGSGPVIQGVFAGANSTNLYGAVQTINGNADNYNGWNFTPWVWVTKGRTLDLSIDWPVACPLSSAGIVQVTLEGLMIEVGNT